MNKKGSNQYKNKYYNWLGLSKKVYHDILWLFLLVLILSWSFYLFYKPPELISAVMDQYPSGVCGTCMKPSSHPETYKQQVLKYIVDKFGDDAPDAIVLLRKCENSTFGMDRVNTNKNGTKDFGTFQINSIHAKRYGTGFLNNWRINVDVAYEIYKSRSNTFGAWTCKWVL